MGRPFCICGMLSYLFPFMKLSSPVADRSESAYANTVQSFHIVFLCIVIWTGTAAIFMYVFLTLGSHSSAVPKHLDEDGRVKWELMRELPDVGTHLGIVMSVKRIFEVFILHWLCTYVMEPLKGIDQLKETHLDLMRPTGIFQYMRKLANRLCCRPHRERWLSAFTVDHVLLGIVGLCAVVNNLLFIHLKSYAHNEVFLYPSACDVPDWFLWLEATIKIYRSINMIGFLVMTLEYNMVPKVGHVNEFNILIALAFILWMVDFGNAILLRTIYTGTWVKVRHVAIHITVALGQLFYTHSSAMLGAIMFGHSSHFRKSPDLTKDLFISSYFPCSLLLAVFIAWTYVRRYTHTWGEELNPISYRFFVIPYPYIMSVWAAVGGMGLLAMSSLHHDTSSTGVIQARPSVGVKEDIVSFAIFLDYDSAIVLCVFSLAVLFNLVSLYEAFAERHWMTFVSHVGGLMAPVGLASFVLSLWRTPPHPSTGARTWMWFACAFAITMFLHFQIKEDCAFTSAQPACCDYPGLPDWNNKRRSMCDKAARCTHKSLVEVLGSKRLVFCAFHEAHEEVEYCGAGHGSGSSHRQLTGVRGHHHGGHRSPNLADIDRPETIIDSDCCCCEEANLSRRVCSSRNESYYAQCTAQANVCIEELQCRWDRFSALGLPAIEAMEHSNQESSSYKLFEALGMAATIEFYFTCIGVLFKVVLLSTHPHSDEIQSLESHHHYVDHVKGENLVVARDRRLSGCDAARIESFVAAHPSIGNNNRRLSGSSEARMETFVSSHTGTVASFGGRRQQAISEIIEAQPSLSDLELTSVSSTKL